MIKDKSLQFCDGLVLAGLAIGTAVLGDVIDIMDQRDLGTSGPFQLVILVAEDIVGGDAATIEFQLVSGDRPAISDDGAAAVHISSGSFAKADLKAGKKFIYNLPQEGTAYERYIGLRAVVTAAELTGGKIHAFLTNGAASWKAYEEARS